MILALATVLANAAAPCRPHLDDWRDLLEGAGMVETARAMPRADVLAVTFANLQTANYAEIYIFQDGQACLVEVGTGFHILLGETG